MNKKKLAQEILILFGSALLILVISGVWYLIYAETESTEEPSQKIYEEKSGYREEVYHTLYSERETFREIIELYHKPTFFKNIADKSLNREIYITSKEFNYYTKNNKRITEKRLEKKLGDGMQNFIDRLDYIKTTFLTDLSYEEFNKKIQSDTLWSKTAINVQEVEEEEEEEETIIQRDVSSDFKIIALIILLITFPLRYIIKIIKWSLKEIKTTSDT